MLPAKAPETWDPIARRSANRAVAQEEETNHATGRATGLPIVRAGQSDQGAHPRSLRAVNFLFANQLREWREALAEFIREVKGRW